MTAHRRDRRRRLMAGVLRLVTVAALVVVDLVVTALVTGRVAQACSCVEYTVDSALGEGDAAFIGAAIDRRYEGTPGNDPVVYAFDVTDIVKGELPAQIDVWTGEGDGDCGVQFEIGEPVGVVLRGDRERWRTSTCGGVWLPDELRSPGALAAPTGSGQVALLATGRTGEAMIASFDATGGLAAWGLGNARDELSHLRVCPGSTTAVGMTMNVAGETHVVRRSVATLAPAGSVLLPARQPDSWPQLIDNRGVQCTSPDGDVAFLVSASGYNDAAAGNAVVWVDGDATTVHPVEQGWAFAVHPDLASGYLLSGADGTVVERITFADGNRHTVAELPDGLGGRFLAVEGATGRIAVVRDHQPDAPFER